MEQARHFLQRAEREAYHPVWHLALFTGMHPFERLALRWASLDLQTGTLTAREAAPVMGGKRHEGPPKCDAGKRAVRLEAGLVATLHTHRAAQLERRLLLGGRWHEHVLVCASEVGTLSRHRNLGRRFHQLCEQAGVPYIRPYDLRHTTTSIMTASGSDIKAASEVLGHANRRTTAEIIQHIEQQARNAVSATVSAAIMSHRGAHVTADVICKDDPREMAINSGNIASGTPGGTRTPNP